MVDELYLVTVIKILPILIKQLPTYTSYVGSALALVILYQIVYLQTRLGIGYKFVKPENTTSVQVKTAEFPASLSRCCVAAVTICLLVPAFCSYGTM